MAETKSDAQLAEERRDEERFGDDPNKVDRLKIYGLHEKNGKYYQQIGDEFFEVDQKEIRGLND